MVKKRKMPQQQGLAEQLDAEAQEKRMTALSKRRMLRRRTAYQGDEARDAAEVAEEEDDGCDYLDPHLSRKIFSQASAMLSEDDEAKRRQFTNFSNSSLVKCNTQLVGKEVENSEDSDVFSTEDSETGDSEVEEDKIDDPTSIGSAEGLSEAEQTLVSSFTDATPSERRTLADVILTKIKEKEEVVQEGSQTETLQGITPRIRQVYTEIGKLLKSYTAGKLPKAFKIMPSLINWEEVVYLTRPDEWTPHATYAATKIFASNLNEKLSQRFFNLVLLEKCRDDIEEHKKLNYHLYMSLKKATYKPGAFFKGIVLPLIQSDCTVREATIFSSILTKVSVPVNHAAVVLLKLATALDYSASCSIFLKDDPQRVWLLYPSILLPSNFPLQKSHNQALLNKRYSLPFQVIDVLVDYFVRFAEMESASLPVLWHQSLLVFAQRYKEVIKWEDKERIKEVLKRHAHYQITPEVRRQLWSSCSRGQADTRQSEELVRGMKIV